ncbi:MAG: hypothetical protein GY711_00115 [bacterium]|nr:hypothetical protein [bacterium]
MRLWKGRGRVRARGDLDVERHGLGHGHFEPARGVGRDLANGPTRLVVGEVEVRVLAVQAIADRDACARERCAQHVVDDPSAQHVLLRGALGLGFGDLGAHLALARRGREIATFFDARLDRRLDRRILQIDSSRR